MILLRPLLRAAAAAFATYVALVGFEVDGDFWILLAVGGIVGALSFGIAVYDELTRIRLHKEIDGLVRSLRELVPAEPTVPFHVQNLSTFSTGALKGAVANVAAQMRLLEAGASMKSPDYAAIIPSVDTPPEESFRNWLNYVSHDSRRQNQAQEEFNLRLRPDGLALRSELRRRLGIFPPFKHDESRALDSGMLTGVNMLSLIAGYLEDMAARLPD
jgi:hypothetical protein